MKDYDDNERYYEDDELENNINDQYEEDEFSDLYDSDDIWKDEDSAPSKKERKKEYYVKGADLKAELKKYHDSKKESENGQRIYF
jgi:hypothetical protein